MGYEEEMEPIAEALAAAGYHDDLRPDREICLLRMRKQTAAGAIVVMVGGIDGQNGFGMPIWLRAVSGDKTFESDLRISPAGADTDLDQLIARFEAALLSSD